jgi:hypothetical protein
MTDPALPATRLTPYELAFGEARFEDERFPAIRAEAEARSVDTGERERMLMLGTVGALLRELRPDSADIEGTDDPLPPPDVVRDYGALLFLAYRFWENGRRLLTIDEGVLRSQLARGPIGDWAFVAPHPAGYLQLPRHVLWARIAEAAPPEAVDGFFWSIAPPGTGTAGGIEIVVALGMHPGRPGFSVMEAAAPLPAPAPGHWGDLDARADGEDFDNILPGGEMRELVAVTSTPELLKLVSRIFHYIDASPASMRPVQPGQDEPEGTHTLPASALPAMAITEPDGT